MIASRPGGTPPRAPVPGERDGPRPSLLRRAWGFLAGHTDEWVLVGLAAFLFLVATNTQTGWLYVVVALIVAVLVVGYVAPRSTLRGLEVRRRLPAPGRVGEDVRIELEVRNPGPTDRHLVALEEALPPGLPGEPRRRRFLLERIPARGVARVSYRLACTLRGCYRFSPVRLRTGTPLGLFPTERPADAGDDELLIHPRGVRLPRAPLRSLTARRAMGSRTFPRAGASEDFMGIRAYSQGEDIRFVHWPATARTGELMIREFRETSGQSLAILVENGEESDWGEGAESTLETAIVAAASLAELARRQGLALTVLAERAGHLEARRGTPGDQVLDFLARICPEGRMGWAEMLLEARPLVPPDCHLFLLATRPLADPGLLAALSGRRDRVTVVLFPAPAYRVGGPPLREDLGGAAYDRCLRALAASGVDVRTHTPGQDMVETLLRGRRG